MVVTSLDKDIKVATVRMQFEIPYEKAQEIEALMRDCGFESKKDFFNNAFTLLKWAVRNAKKGNLIAGVNVKEDKYTELSMPFLEHVRENNREHIKHGHAWVA